MSVAALAQSPSIVRHRITQIYHVYCCILPHSLLQTVMSRNTMYVAILFMSVFCASAVKRYCVSCEKKHSSTRWRLYAGVFMCHKSYVSFWRHNLPGVPHPAHVVLDRYSKSLDSTNRRIVAIKYRVDATTFREAYVLLGRIKGWTLAQRLWLLGIVGQLYWSWPMLTALTLVGKKPFFEVYQPSFL